MRYHAIKCALASCKSVLDFTASSNNNDPDLVKCAWPHTVLQLFVFSPHAFPQLSGSERDSRRCSASTSHVYLSNHLALTWLFSKDQYALIR